MAQGDEDQALGCFARAYQYRPELKDALRNAMGILLRRAGVAEASGNREAARTALEQALEISPNDASIKDRISNLRGD